MRQRTKLVLVFIAGLVLGAVAAGALVGRHWMRSFADWYALGVAEQAGIAIEIHRGREAELAERVTAALPGYVVALDGELAGSPLAEQALWMVEEAYELSGTPVPPAIEGILDALPPKPPGCCRPPGLLERGAGGREREGRPAA